MGLGTGSDGFGGRVVLRGKRGGVIIEKTIQGGREHRGFGEVGYGFVIGDDDGLIVIEFGPDGILAQVVIRFLKVAEGGATKGTSGLIAGVGRGFVFGGGEGREEFHLHEPGEALIEELPGDIQVVAEFGGGGGKPAGVKVATDFEQDGE